MKQVITKHPFTQTLPYFFLMNSLKEKSLMKLICLTLNPFQLFLKSLVEVREDKIKHERNITYLNLS